MAITANDLAIDAIDARAILAADGPRLSAMPHLSAFFGGRRIARAPAQYGGALAWGVDRAAHAAQARAMRKGVPFARIENGFVSAVGAPASGAPTVSLVVDDVGLHFDARGPSRLERLLREAAASDAAAANGLRRWRDERLSQFNVGADQPPRRSGRRVVIVDQRSDDPAIAGSGASPTTFETMIQTALSERAASAISIYAPPETLAGKRQSPLRALALRFRLDTIEASVSPRAVLDIADEVWTVSSMLGFEAILCGLRVTTFATPFYAGWGLTDDRARDDVAEAAKKRRGGAPTAEQMFAATFLGYARYADPVTRRPLDFNGALDRLADWRARDRLSAGFTTFCFGFQRWKRGTAPAFLGGTAAKLRFEGRARPHALARISSKATNRVAVWGMTDEPGFVAACAARGLPVLRIEDGFLRSVGLGSDLLAPGSVVLDDRGLYYDADSPSRLETLLQNHAMPPDLIARAAALRLRIVEKALTKYNLPSPASDLRAAAKGRPVVLVAEQVPGDAALRYGGGDLDGNFALLQAVRAQRPDAYLAYKEHPDLVAGNRRGRLPAQTLRGFADLVISSGDMEPLYRQADELHTLSSLAGFEALLRSLKVVVWGRPFYAGWGLTTDKMAFARRSRALSLDQLVAGALILYPSYAAPLTWVPCSVEDFLDSLDALRAGPREIPSPDGWRRQAARFGRWLRAHA